jgi:hypothetical protein
VLRFPCLHHQFPSGFADGCATSALPETDVLRAHLIKAGAFYSLPDMALRRLRVGLHDTMHASVCWRGVQERKACSNDPVSVLHFVVAEGFLPFADFKGGVIGLDQKAGNMGLGDTCLGYAEHGDHVFSDENRSDLNWDLAELMQLVVNRKREGVTNLSLDELLP